MNDIFRGVAEAGRNDVEAEMVFDLARRMTAKKEEILRLLGGDPARLSIGVRPNGVEIISLDGRAMIELGPIETSTEPTETGYAFKAKRYVRKLYEEDPNPRLVK
jgi:hypothetical protein